MTSITVTSPLGVFELRAAEIVWDEYSTVFCASEWGVGPDCRLLDPSDRLYLLFLLDMNDPPRIDVTRVSLTYQDESTTEVYFGRTADIQFAEFESGVSASGTLRIELDQGVIATGSFSVQSEAARVDRAPVTAQAAYSRLQ